MTCINGWAYTDTQNEEQKKRLDRFNEMVKELRLLDKKVSISERNAGYARSSVTLVFPEEMNVSELDALIFSDNGNTCFGGEVYKLPNNAFRCEVYTD